MARKFATISCVLFEITSDISLSFSHIFSKSFTQENDKTTLFGI